MFEESLLCGVHRSDFVGSVSLDFFLDVEEDKGRGVDQVNEMMQGMEQVDMGQITNGQ